MWKTKEDFIKDCAELFKLKEAILALELRTDYRFCITENRHIHMMSDGFDEAAEIVQAEVFFDPDYTEDNGKKYFHLTIDNKEITVFALYSKEDN